jgi:hypothetical protein
MGLASPSGTSGNPHDLKQIDVSEKHTLLEASERGLERSA